MDFAVRREGAAVTIGLHGRRSESVVDMRACPVLHPALFTLVQALRPVLRRLVGLRKQGSVMVNLLDSGPDLLLRTDATLTAGDRVLLTGLASAQGLPRVSWSKMGGPNEPETACQLQPATANIGGWRTEPPPGAFLQASAEGEQAIVAAVLAALPAPGNAKSRIVELFAGLGSITQALAATHRVTAYEGDAAAVAALRRAGNPRVSAVHRDLARQPLQPSELKSASAIVLDPPYAGAPEQMPALAGSGLPVIYVSCNPGALARDARVLARAGYRVASQVVIDQFLWSAGVECVTAFLPA